MLSDLLERVDDFWIGTDAAWVGKGDGAAISALAIGKR
jgi:hypothetical protein